MKRYKRVFVLLGILVALCAATLAVLGWESHQEQIQNSDAVILELKAEDVTALHWTYDDTDLAFTRNDEGVWHWDEDEAFPVSSQQIDRLLDVFSAFGASFIIEDVEDHSQYGLDAPACTIRLTTAEQTYTVTLGDFSKLDEQRYVSIGDGNVYLVNTDPMDTYDTALKKLIQNDTMPDCDVLNTVTFAGTQDYTFTYEEEGMASPCEDDAYFTDGRPLDTELVESYMTTLFDLDLTDYMTYNVTEEELQTYGLDDPELTITLEHSTQGEGDQMVSGTTVLSVSRDAETRAKETAGEEIVGSPAGYLRVDQSPILYKISATTLTKVMACGYDDLRHKEAFTADADLITSIEVELEGATHLLTTGPDPENEDEILWYYEEQEIDLSAVKADLEDLTATAFTDEAPTGQQEIKLTLLMDHEHFPLMEVTLYRYDGTSCLAVVNGESFALVSRSGVVDLIESVNAIVLN